MLLHGLFDFCLFVAASVTNEGVQFAVGIGFTAVMLIGSLLYFRRQWRVYVESIRGNGVEPVVHVADAIPTAM